MNATDLPPIYFTGKCSSITPFEAVSHRSQTPPPQSSSIVNIVTPIIEKKQGLPKKNKNRSLHRLFVDYETAKKSGQKSPTELADLIAQDRFPTRNDTIESPKTILISLRNTDESTDSECEHFNLFSRKRTISEVSTTSIGLSLDDRSSKTPKDEFFTNGRLENETPPSSENAHVKI